MGEETVLGVFGGSGLYAIEGLEERREIELSTPFGAPSDHYITGRLDGVRMVFLPRHARGHRIPPSEINFRANVWGMKRMGATRVLSVSAVGSMRENIEPGDFVIVDQFIDRTRHRPDTFFGDGIVAHVMFAEPVCPQARAVLATASREIGVRVHEGGTYLNMEGPQFSTRAESRMYREWGADVIGMTNLQEAKLAREAELCYATVAMATDFDCWHDGHEDVTIEAVLAVMNRNVENARNLIRAAAPLFGEGRTCGCSSALESAIITDPEHIPAATKTRLQLLIGKYIE